MCVCVKKYNIIIYMKYGVAMPWWFFKLEYTIWIIWFIVLWTCRIFYKIINYRRTPCSSVIVCIPTMLTESHGSSRQRYGFPRNLHGGNTVSARIIPDEAFSRTNTDDHGCFELSKTSVLASRFPTDHPGRSRTNKDHYGPTRQLHGSYAGSPRMWSVLIRHLYGTGALHVWFGFRSD